MDLRAPRTALLCSALLLPALATPASADLGTTLPFPPPRLPVRAFTLTTPQPVPGGEVVAGPARWDPCTVIRWRIDLTGAPRGALAQAKEAVRRLRVATGLRFSYDGLVSTGRRGPAPALTITFASPVRMGGDLGLGGWHAEAVGNGRQVWRITSASIVIDRGRAARMPGGFGPGPTLGQVLMHELGHAVGLGHSTDQRNVMYANPTTHTAAWGPGDLAGLRAVGASLGCLPAR